MSKIIGVTVGTPISPKRVEEKIKPVKTVNNQEPDENGNVEVIGSNGKSAYEYAKEGGYTGTEAEFAAKLAAEYLTSESDPTVPSWAKQSAKPTYTASEVGALPASTKIPTKVSELINDSEYIIIDDVGDYLLDSSEEWVFTLEDGSTVAKKVVLG